MYSLQLYSWNTNWRDSSTERFCINLLIVIVKKQWETVTGRHIHQLFCSVKIELQYGLHLNLNPLLIKISSTYTRMYTIVVFVLKTNIDASALLSWKPKDLSLSESLRAKLEMIFPIPKPIGLKKASKPLGGWAEKKWEVALLNTEVWLVCFN